MTYGFVHNVPVSPDGYRAMKAAIGDLQPEGLIGTIVYSTATGVCEVSVWRSEADWTRFRAEVAQPILARMIASGEFTPPEAMEEPQPIEVLDVLFATAP